MISGILDYSTIAGFTTYQNAYILCVANAAIVLTILPGACLTLLVMSFERYQAVAVIRLRKIKLTTVLKIILIIWLTAIVSAVIPTVYVKFNNYYPNVCTIGRIDNYTLLIISIILFSTTSILPIIMMLIIYGLIIYKLIYSKQVVKIGPSSITNNREKNIRRTIFPVLLISVFTTASSVPYILLSYYTLINEYYYPYFGESFLRKYYRLWIFAATWYILSPIVNPFLYNLASSKFRKILHSLLCYRRRSLFHTKIVWIKPISGQGFDSSRKTS
ncbi:hypothetical protein TrispH2_012103 [Trichoplax sp. H2]|nr:hypothetical protein TrispH2_012103 [Trichoplax sp. H2]|eukprot:RDD36056.1 hypothetical protein TrispH2_012103 [Trichoplax sp. H2]